ncbi:putative 149 kDa protein [Labeo rohita]|uniref:149 kDa protein n=1 Tax=Labeo rohita TaxID=84645 RepID=A0ABQ8MGF4_LABRO|nr:putative 149 kDa protein [Labeo rohita]
MTRYPIPNGTLHLPGYQLFRADRDAESTGKLRGGGTCFYINERWCTDVTVLKMCCSCLEALFINCKPFYSPREIHSFILVSVYISPQAHVSLSLQKLADQITELEQQHPDSVLIVLGDFNKANLSKIQTASLGLSDHCLVHLIPTYRQKPKSAKPVAKTISEDEVRHVYRKNKRRKAPGPDGVTPACLKTCADQLAPIFSQIFNRSLELCEVPSCFKRSTIIPVPKKPKIIGLNDYRPVALTKHGTALHPATSGNYVRILFVDFSSAFNTIIPTLLQSKLAQLSLSSSICQWITSFLTDRQQLVRMGKFTSNSCTTSTGAPQHRVPKQPDIEKASSLRPSTS